MHNERHLAKSPSRASRKRRSGSTGGSSNGSPSTVTTASEPTTEQVQNENPSGPTRKIRVGSKGCSPHADSSHFAQCSEVVAASNQVPPRRCSARLKHASVEVGSSQGATTSTTGRSSFMATSLRRSIRVTQCLGTKHSQVRPKLILRVME